mmetsp:Transcript_365/g.759  ORF Transcript_365/g.759 Transcript_365/m.759 type:complete len:264 (+) Transcript_365:26-817(+)
MDPALSYQDQDQDIEMKSETSVGTCVASRLSPPPLNSARGIHAVHVQPGCEVEPASRVDKPAGNKKIDAMPQRNTRHAALKDARLGSSRLLHRGVRDLVVVGRVGNFAGLGPLGDNHHLSVGLAAEAPDIVVDIVVAERIEERDGQLEESVEHEAAEDRRDPALGEALPVVFTEPVAYVGVIIVVAGAHVFPSVRDRTVGLNPGDEENVEEDDNVEHVLVRHRDRRRDNAEHALEQVHGVLAILEPEVHEVAGVAHLFRELSS